MVKKSKKEITAMILSILVSFFMWIYVMAEEDPLQPRVIYDVPVTLTNTENIEQSNLALLPNQKFTVNISVTGRSKEIYGLTTPKFKLEADMSGYLKKGENTIPVSIKDAPNGITINQKYNLSVIVRLDTLAQKTVPVYISTIGEPKDGFGTYDVSAKKTEEAVMGPQEYINQVASLRGQIDIADATGDINGTATLKAVDKDGKTVLNVTPESKVADAYVTIKPAKIVPIHINTTGKVDDQYTLKSVKPKIDKVKIIGDRKNIDKIKQIESFPFDVSKVVPNFTGNVQLNIPSGVVVSGDIKSVNVNFELSNNSQKTFNIPVTASNQKSNYNYQLTPAAVVVTIMGDNNVVSAVDVSSITATVDATNFVEGNNNNVNVNVSVPSNVTISNEVPQKVQVNMTKK